MSLNHVMMIGNLGQDPEIRYTPSGLPLVNFSVATDESYLDKEGKRQERVAWYLKRGSMTPSSEQDGYRPPGSWEHRQELAELCVALKKTSTNGRPSLISDQPERVRHRKIQSSSKLVASSRWLAPSLAVLLGISASLAWAPMLAYADEGRLVALAAKRFQNLTVAERRLLEYADIDNPHRGEFSISGSSSEPKDASNDPAHSDSWPVKRTRTAG